MSELVRVNTRISKGLNDWLDKESMATGTPKSALISQALENMKREREVIQMMADATSLYQVIEENNKKIEERFERLEKLLAAR